MPLDPQVSQVVDAYLAQTGDLVEGLYLYGSVALDDFRPGLSDIDFVAVTSQPLSSAAKSKLEQVHVHASLPGPVFDGIYLTWEELAAGPAAIQPTPFARERKLHAAGRFEHNPITWHTLATLGVHCHGPSSLEIWTDAAALATYQRENLRGYWSSWVTAMAKPWSYPLYFRSGASWGVLGIPRLHHTLRTGGITSKTGAGEYALSTFDSRWHRVIEDCIGERTGRPSTYRLPLRRRQDALRFMRIAIDDALRG